MIRIMEAHTGHPTDRLRSLRTMFCGDASRQEASRFARGDSDTEDSGAEHHRPIQNIVTGRVHSRFARLTVNPS